MNSTNLEYLQNSLKYLGFSNALNGVLEANMKKNDEKFIIGATAEFDSPQSIKDKKVVKDTVNYELFFNKSPSTDFYFFNSYKATLNKGELSALSNTFYLNKGNDITAKEAYNLLSGRSIQKIAEIPEKFILLQKDPAGKMETTPVNNLNEAKELVQSLVEKNKDLSTYDLIFKDSVVRSFDHNGKEKKHNYPALELQYSYFNPYENKSFSNIYPISSINEAKDVVKNLISEGQQDKIESFHVYEAKTKAPVVSFDNKGSETNLAAGVRKENIWIKLDFENKEGRPNIPFKVFYPNYGFDLQKEVQKLPIIELKEQDNAKMLYSSLSRGNVQAATIEKTGERVYIEANPQYKTLNIYDKDFNLEKNRLMNDFTENEKYKLGKGI